MDLTPPPTIKRHQLDSNPTGSKRQRLDESPQQNQSDQQKQIPPSFGVILMKVSHLSCSRDSALTGFKLMGRLIAWVREPESAIEQAERFQAALRHLALLGDNVCSASKFCEEGLDPDAVALVHEAEIKPRRQKKRTKKTKDATVDSMQKPNPPVSRREKTSTPRYNSRDDSDNSDNEMRSTLPSFRSQHELRVTPSQQGDRWRNTWAPLSANLTPATQIRVKDVLGRIFSPLGVQDALDMAEQVEQNHDILGLDAASHSIIKLSSVDSPARAVAVRFKTVWDQNLSKEIKGARLLNSYRLLAQEIQTLEHQAMHAKTPIGALFYADRDPERRREPTEGTASAFVLDHLLEIMFADSDRAQRKVRHKRLTKDREIARNVNSIVEIFGTGIIPLMCKASWQST
jgi:hypothetical protein